MFNEADPSLYCSSLLPLLQPTCGNHSDASKVVLVFLMWKIMNSQMSLDKINTTLISFISCPALCASLEPCWSWQRRTNLIYYNKLHLFKPNSTFHFLCSVHGWKQREKIRQRAKRGPQNICNNYQQHNPNHSKGSMNVWTTTAIHPLAAH